MDSYYLAIDYVCNHKCKCCPCSKEQKADGFFQYEYLVGIIDKIKKTGITSITISGGEPTLHPDFLKLIKYLYSEGFIINILSNGEKFSDNAFFNSFLSLFNGDIDNVRITTTFHSFSEEKYEEQNGVKGSFKKVLSGLQKLDQAGFNIALKQCITKFNYKDLLNYIKFILSNFSGKNEIQFWGIDFAGISKDEALTYYVSFHELRPYLEQMIDYFEHNNSRNVVLSINNIPLCSLDIKYWRYFSLPYIEGYMEKNNLSARLAPNYGPCSSNCESCRLRAYCRGAYKTVFEYFGDTIVNEPDIVNIFSNYINKAVQLNKKNYNNLFWSPNIMFRFEKSGLVLFNKENGNYIKIISSGADLINMLKILDNGVSGEMLLPLLSKMKPCGEDLLELLIKKRMVI